MSNVVKTVRWSPILMGAFFRILIRRIIKVLPRAIVRQIEKIRGRIPFGSVSFGDLRRQSPIGRGFGSDRGTPVDRYYIEHFLSQNAVDIRGHVLEFLDNHYTLRFGGSRVERSDILSVEVNPHATIVGDLAQSDVLPEAAFDCIVLTQVLQYIFDLRAAVTTLHRALKPGGVLLLTVPGISQIDHGSWSWYWTFTGPVVRRLLEEQFGQDVVSVETRGNIFAATAFLYGIAKEELEASELNFDDANYAIIVAARAVKAKDT